MEQALMYCKKDSLSFMYCIDEFFFLKEDIDE